MKYWDYHYRKVEEKTIGSDDGDGDSSDDDDDHSDGDDNDSELLRGK